MNARHHSDIIKKQPLSYSLPPSGCPLIFPREKSNETCSSHILKTEIDTYFAIADGQKRTYTNDDGLIKYDTSNILNPNDVSFYNLFVNGVLQPYNVYEVTEGSLYFKTKDVPIQGVPIILQFIKIYNTF